MNYKNLLSHSRSFKIFRNYTDEWGVRKVLLVGLGIYYVDPVGPVGTVGR